MVSRHVGFFFGTEPKSVAAGVIGPRWGDGHWASPGDGAASLFWPVLKEMRMSGWKVLFIMAFACVCFGLVLATLVVPLALTAEEHRWLWFAGLLLASI